MKLVEVIDFNVNRSIAFVGAGGKTTAIFDIARQLNDLAFVTTTTKIAVSEKDFGDHWFEIKDIDDLESIDFVNLEGVCVFTGRQIDDVHMGGLSVELVTRLKEIAIDHNGVLLIEADGSKKKMLKAPLSHEPVIPDFVDSVIVSAGLNILGEKLNEEIVHRAERFSELSGLKIGEFLKVESLIDVLINQEGGLKGIPSSVKRMLHLTHTNSQALIDNLGIVRGKLLKEYSQVVFSDLKNGQIQVEQVFNRIAGVILAAGGASRARTPKQLLDWFGESIIRKVCKIALNSKLSKIIVVTGDVHQEIKDEISDLDIEIINNKNWGLGISISIKVGLKEVMSDCEAVMFILADLPQIPAELIDSIIDGYEKTLPPITLPIIGDKRGNPVLFDNITYSELLVLKGDSGGRQLFSKFNVKEISWDDIRLNLDIDTIEDYESLLSLYE